MKTNRYSALAIRQQHGGLFNSRLFVAALILALLFASFSAANVFAAPANDSDQPWEKIDLAKEWKDKLHQLAVEGLFYNQVQFHPADFENSADLTRAWNLLHNHGLALAQANTVVLNHTGFDSAGNVINGRLAYGTVHELAMHLHTMRGLRMKIFEEGHKVSRVR